MASIAARGLSSAARQMRSRSALSDDNRQPTIVDVARAAGVSPMTVSRVMNGGSSSEQSRAAVERAVRDLDYRPSEVARQLSQARMRRTPSNDRAPATQAMPMQQVWQPYADFWLNLLKTGS